MENITVNQADFIAVNTAIDNVKLENEVVLRVIKADKINEPDENTYAKVKNIDFHNGEIEVKVYSKLLTDAPDHARGFIGIAFRINEDDSAFESFYIRPTNGKTDDPIRKNRAFQYFSYPKYTFSYFRDLNIKDYEGSADIDLHEWITLKAIIKDSKGEFYINDLNKPVLVVEKMFHKDHARGGIGFFVDIGTEGYFKDLKVKLYD